MFILRQKESGLSVKTRIVCIKCFESIYFTKCLMQSTCLLMDVELCFFCEVFLIKHGRIFPCSFLIAAMKTLHTDIQALHLSLCGVLITNTHSKMICICGCQTHKHDKTCASQTLASHGHVWVHLTQHGALSLRCWKSKSWIRIFYLYHISYHVFCNVFFPLSPALQF